MPVGADTEEVGLCNCGGPVHEEKYLDKKVKKTFGPSKETKVYRCQHCGRNFWVGIRSTPGYTNPDGSLKIVADLTPPCTKECKNDRCFWRQRNEFGLSPWYYNAPMDDPGKIKHEKEQMAIRRKYGDPFFPELKVYTGTNQLSLVCEGWVGSGSGLFMYKPEDDA
jgi:hypothetical protein